MKILLIILGGGALLSGLVYLLRGLLIEDDPADTVEGQWREDDDGTP